MRVINAVDLDFAAVRAEFELDPAFAPEVEREAREAPDRFAGERIDARAIPFVTIDPPGSMDLDQAVHLERHRDGFVLRYAIADVGAFVAPGSALDAESRRRGQTIYLPDGTVPLHPRSLAEERASLVAGTDRPAVLWEIEAAATGRLVRARVRRALVRVVARLDYAQVQDAVDRDAELPAAIDALPSFGEARARRALERGAIELQLPTQQLTRAEGGWRLRLEPRTRADAWNSECSLAAGIAAAACMVAGGRGLLRTLPRPDAESLRRFRDAARAFDVRVPAGVDLDRAHPGELLAALPPRELATMALHMAATKLLRGSGYLAFDEATGVPAAEARWHAGVASEYAHVTAPIRRLGDRFAAEACLELSAGEWWEIPEREGVAAGHEGPGEVAGRLDGVGAGVSRRGFAAPQPAEQRAADAEVPAIMNRTSQLSNAVQNACLNLAEAVVLRDSVGETFRAGMLRPADERHDAEVFVFEPPVIAQCRGEVPPGQPLEVRLVEADPARRRVRFER